MSRWIKGTHVSDSGRPSGKAEASASSTNQGVAQIILLCDCWGYWCCFFFVVHFCLLRLFDFLVACWWVCSHFYIAYFPSSITEANVFVLLVRAAFSGWCVKVVFVALNMLPSWCPADINFIGGVPDMHHVRYMMRTLEIAGNLHHLPSDCTAYFTSYCNADFQNHPHF